MDHGLWHEDYSALKYSEGEEYRAHYDGHTATGRSISALVYLNSNFDGGELEFVNFGIKIKPQPGMLILFPSNFAYQHIAHPIVSGTKYSLVTWIKDRAI
jgi:predicted 2-oxoglutarate/Fe(II)-dependent dioxygenase YbiX